MCDLNSLTRYLTYSPCIGRWILNNWTTRKVPSLFFLNIQNIYIWTHAFSRRIHIKMLHQLYWQYWGGKITGDILIKAPSNLEEKSQWWLYMLKYIETWNYIFHSGFQEKNFFSISYLITTAKKYVEIWNYIFHSGFQEKKFFSNFLFNNNNPQKITVLKQSLQHI